MHYLITIRSTAQTMGIYEGASPDELRADLSVEPVAVQDMVVSIADAMVALDRDSGDCLPETLSDPEAGDASDWDARSMASTAEDVAGSIGRIVAEQYRERILATYRVAWRNAVESADC